VQRAALLKTKTSGSTDWLAERQATFDLLVAALAALHYREN
jgi:hypothetical protein